MRKKELFAFRFLSLFNWRGFVIRFVTSGTTKDNFCHSSVTPFLFQLINKKVKVLYLVEFKERIIHS